jgi:F-box protein 11
MAKDLSGQDFNRYRLSRQLGRGTFGQVYLAEKRRAKQAQLALKVLEPLDTEAEFAKYLNEVRALVSLHHRYIVPILDCGVDDDTKLPFIVMEYAANGSLGQRYDGRKQIALADIVRYIRQAADALQFAHDEQFIHRDVKPDNMLIGTNGDLLLSDFGIAVMISSGHTSPAGPAGTALYMAPEQIRGYPGPSSDQYALAVIAYELLCGRPPFIGMLAEVYSQHLTVAPPPIQNPDIPPAVKQVVMKALKKTPEERFPAIAQFAQALEAAASYPVAPPAPPLSTVVVAKSGGDYTSIGEAVRRVGTGTRILVRPGTYEESVMLSRSVEIVGDGPRERIIIESRNGNCVVMSTAKAAIRNMTLRCRVSHQNKKYSAVDVPQGQLTLDNCDITSNSAACIDIHNTGTSPVVHRCVIHDSKGAGIFFYDGAGGEVNDCDIFGNAFSGIEIKDRSDPKIVNCRIHDGAAAGILVDREGKGQIEKCDIFSNAASGIEIKHESHPIISSCSIHHGRGVGVYVWDYGRGELKDDCKIFENAFAGIEIRQGSDPIIRNSRVYNGKDVGIYVWQSGQGKIIDCWIYGNSKAAVCIQKGGNPAIRQCQIYKGKDDGVFIFQYGRGVIEDCEISDNEKTGIEIRHKSRPAIARCHVNRNGGFAVWAYDEAAGEVSDCDLSDNTFGEKDISLDSATRIL